MKLRANIVPIVCAGAVFALVTLSACANRTTTIDGSGTVAADAAAPAAKPAKPKAKPAARAVDLKVVQTELGPVVVGPDGRTLYRFDEDSPKPPTSSCNRACLDAWPPLLGDAGTATAAGVDRSLLGSLTRPDGTKQLTLNGWPLYFFAGDEGPGDLNGEGVGDVWHAIGPNGKPAVSAGAGAEPDSGSEPDARSEPGPDSESGSGSESGGVQPSPSGGSYGGYDG